MGIHLGKKAVIPPGYLDTQNIQRMPITQYFTATDGQTVFNLSSSYELGKNQVSVEVESVPQSLGVGFTETSTTSITLSEGVSAGTNVAVRIFATPDGMNAKLTQLDASLADMATDVKQFGAKGDGVTDDTVAIQKAIQYLLSLKNDTTYRGIGTILFPNGIYKVSNKVFSNVDFSAFPSKKGLYGIRFVGTHIESSVLMLDAPTSNTWFYNNGANNACFQRMYFENMEFTSNNFLNGNGFKIYSTGGEKQFNFNNCKFTDINNFFYTDGNGNADLCRFLNCKIETYGDILTLNNTQSVSHAFIECDTRTYGNFIHNVGGGGNVLVQGGAHDFMYNEQYSPTIGNFIVHIESGAASSQGNNTYTFRDTRFEVEAYMQSSNDPKHGIVNTYDYPSINQPMILFDGAIFVNGITYITDSNGMTLNSGGNITSSVYRKMNAVNIFPRKKVTFRDCVLLKTFFYNIGGTRANSGSTNIGGIIEFDSCYDGITAQLPSSYSTLVTIAQRTTISGDIGRLIANNMFSQTSSDPFNKVVLDYDLNFNRSMGLEPSTRVKLFNIKHANLGWPIPSNNTNEYTVTLPAGVFIKRIFIRRVGSGSSTDTYQLFIGSDDKTTILGSSTAGKYSDTHIIDLQNPDIGTLTKLRMWATGTATGFNSSGIAYIEYV